MAKIVVYEKEIWKSGEKVLYEWPPDEKRTPIATSTDSTNSTTDESGGMDISDYYIELKTGSSKIITIDKLPF